MSERREVTVREFIAAIRKNGYKQAFNSLINRPFNSLINRRVEDDNTIYACALGQAYLNLGILNEDGLFVKEFTEANIPIVGRVVNWNDVEHYSLPEIADKLEAEYADILDEHYITIHGDRNRSWA